jgi:hypothetical protein
MLEQVSAALGSAFESNYCWSMAGVVGRMQRLTRLEAEEDAACWCFAVKHAWTRLSVKYVGCSKRESGQYLLLKGCLSLMAHIFLLLQLLVTSHSHTPDQQQQPTSTN